MAKERLHGYWTSKENPNIYVFVEKVYKAGYVTGVMYERLEGGGEKIFFPGLKCTHEELLEKYERGLKH
jgi:hypothetical protein